MELYAVCPRCGCEVIGNGKVPLSVIRLPDRSGGPAVVAGMWRCRRVVAGQAPEVEVPADEEPDSEPMPDEKVEPDSSPSRCQYPISEPKPVQTLKADKRKWTNLWSGEDLCISVARPATKRRLSVYVHLSHSTPAGTVITRWNSESPIWPIPAASVGRPGAT